MQKLLLATIQMLICTTLLALTPTKTYTYTPDSFGLTYEDLYIHTSDSFSIHVWQMSPPPSLDQNISIIISGGDAGNMSQYVFHAYNLVHQGFTVITYDYRGFGSSDSFNILGSFLYYNEFALDLRRVIRFAKERRPTNTIGLYSFSMGTILSSIALQNETVDFLIAEGLSYHPLLVAARLQLQQNKVFLLPDSANLVMSYFDQIKCPMLVFAGELDKITTTKDAKTMCKGHKNRKLIVYKGEHLQGLEILSKRKLGDTYFKEITRFIRKHSRH